MIVKINSKNQITIPAKFRKKYKIRAGEIFELIYAGDKSFLFSRKKSKVMKSADKVAKKVKKENVSMDEWLEILREERKKLFKENYPDIMQPKNQA